MSEDADFKSVSSVEWIKWSFSSALSFGLINYMLGDLSRKYGMAGSYPIFMGMIPMWAIYHYKHTDLEFYKNR